MELILYLTLLFAYKSSLIYARDEVAISSLAELLRSETCDVVLVGLNNLQLETLYHTLKRPVLVETTTFNRKKDLNCRVLVHASDDVSISGKWTSKFQTRYVLMNSSEIGVEVANVSLPTIVVRTINHNKTQIYLACPHSSQLKYVNLWRAGHGFAVNARGKGHQTLLQRRLFRRPCPSALDGQHVVTVSTGRPPYIINSDKKKRGLYGVDRSLLDIVAKRMHFKYNMTYIQSFGEVNDSTGVWTGMIGAVQSGKADFGVGQAAIQWDRYQAVDYTTYTYPNTFHLFAPKPKPVVTYTNFLRPFDMGIWIAIVLSLLFCTLTMVLVMKVPTMTSVERKKVFIGSVWTACYYSQLQAGLKMNTTQKSVWILMGFYFIHVFFMNMSYLCNFRVYVMQTEFEPPIDSDDDIIQYERDVLMVKGTVIPVLYQNSPTNMQRLIFNHTKEKNLFFAYDKGDIPKRIEEQMIRKGDAICTIKLAGVYSFALSESRFGYVPFRVSKYPVFSLYGGMTLPKNKPWRSEVDDIVLGLLQAGIIDHLINSFIPKKYLEEEPVDTSPRSFGIETVLGCFMLLGVGVGGASISFLFELVTGRMIYKDRKKDAINYEMGGRRMTMISK